jgi:beta-phosphoglucomutase-like phosphatase (HAD superfamily)
MSPVSFGPSDVKNPNNLQYAHVPESFWVTKAILFDFDWILREVSNPNRAMPDHRDIHSTLDGLKETFQLLRKFEIRLAITSNLKQEAVISELSRLNLASDFDNIRCFEDAKELKPHSELHLFTMETLGVRPLKAVAFETTLEGVRAAKASGVFCVGTPELNGESDFHLDSLIEQPILILLEEIDRLKRQKFLKV